MSYMSTIYPTNTELDMKGLCSRHRTKGIKSPLSTKTPTQHAGTEDWRSQKLRSKDWSYWTYKRGLHENLKLVVSPGLEEFRWIPKCISLEIKARLKKSSQKWSWSRDNKEASTSRGRQLLIKLPSKQVAMNTKQKSLDSCLHHVGTSSVTLLGTTL